MLRQRIVFFTALLVMVLAAGWPCHAAADQTTAASPVEAPGGGEFDEAFMDEDEAEIAAAAVADPLIHFNRAMFTFNDRLYLWVLEPVARGYRAVLPVVVRTCVKNFFRNLAAPVRIVNSLLQGKPRLASAALGAFVVNTTAGVAGLGDPASRHPELNPGDEDLGQTLGRYGVGNGIYLVLPFLGPSTLRDTVGLIGDRFLAPATYVLTTAESGAATGVEVVNFTSFHIGEYQSLKAAALEPYVALRDAYVQYRRKKVSE